MRSFGLGWVLGVGVSVWMMGCGSATPSTSKSLAENQNPWLHVVPLNALDAQGQMAFALVIEHDDCSAVSSSVHANVTTVNGANTMDLESPGGAPHEAPDGGCTMPAFRTPTYIGRPAGDVTFTVSDGTTTFAMVVRNLFADRQVQIPAGYASAGHAGDHIALQWLPVTDGFDPSLGGGFRLEFDAPMAAGPTWVIMDPTAVMLNAGLIQFTMPPPVANAIRGNEGGWLRFSGAARAGVTRCTGVSRCMAEVRAPDGLTIPFAVEVP